MTYCILGNPDKKIQVHLKVLSLLVSVVKKAKPNLSICFDIELVVKTFQREQSDLTLHCECPVPV